MAEGNKPTSKAKVKTNAKAKVGLTDEEKHLLYDESNGLNAKDKKHALSLMTQKERDQYKLALKKQAALKKTAGIMKKPSHEQHLSDARSDGAKHEELCSDGALCTVHMAAEDAHGCTWVHPVTPLAIRRFHAAEALKQAQFALLKATEQVTRRDDPRFVQAAKLVTNLKIQIRKMDADGCSNSANLQDVSNMGKPTRKIAGPARKQGN